MVSQAAAPAAGALRGDAAAESRELELELRHEASATPTSERAMAEPEPEACYEGASAGVDAELSPRSRRRRKNRDQMRLARQKERETMKQLRDTVQRLEQRYQETLARGIFHSSQSDALSDSTTAISPAAYADLLATSTRLKEERFRCQQELYEKGKLREALERVVGDLNASESAAGPQHLHGVLEPGLPRGSFSPLSNEDAWAHIRSTHARAQSILQTIEQRTKAESWRGSDPPPFFGWRVRHRVNSTEDALLFSFDKPFSHVTALEGMQRMWTKELAMQSYRPRTALAAQSLTVLQHVNQDTYAFQRRLRDGERVVTSEYLRFRLKTAAGYAVGLCSLEKGASAPERLAWASKVTLWTEFRVVKPLEGGEHCVVRISGHTNLDGKGDGSAAQQTAAETIFGLLRWENMNISPVFTFTAG